MSKLPSSVPLLIVTKLQVHILVLGNSLGTSSLNSLLQIAANVKIIENRENAKSTQFVIKIENFILVVLTVQLCPLISCNEDTRTYTYICICICSYN